jgi:hypothetical protein
MVLYARDINYTILRSGLSGDRKPGSLIARYDLSDCEPDIDFAKALLGFGLRYARSEGLQAKSLQNVQ